MFNANDWRNSSIKFHPYYSNACDKPPADFPSLLCTNFIIVYFPCDGADDGENDDSRY